MLIWIFAFHSFNFKQPQYEINLSKSMIRIRPVDMGNIKTHHTWNNDPELNYFDSDFPLDREPLSLFCRRLQEMMDDPNSGSLILEIHHEGDQKLIGIVDIHGIDHINKRCIIECTIAERDYQNQGYGTAAFREAVRYCFDEMGMNKVSSAAFDFNDKWIRILTNLEFTKEGTLREHAVKNGKYADKLVFSLLKSEYVTSDQFQMSLT
ncbi:Protein N-acetyltransferase, RimJ/RimL family [Cyclonatronum proteinivorum]|uniref:Protein N-acetyltransferase, RimJ/RimL family n=2 Tax=Cyclonatronum proteinivorum TaxID=1457365 RepID=A0A345UKD0_9BACT|nr:Protein N-acetyltransferase, RimJ/RimL family [Cyclonatronum proteinivorum]